MVVVAKKGSHNSNYNAPIYVRSLPGVPQSSNFPLSNHTAPTYAGRYTILVFPNYLIALGLTAPMLLYMWGHCPVWYNHLISPGPTTLLLHMQVHHSCVPQLFNCPWSNNSNYNAPVYVRSLSCVPQSFSSPWSDHTAPTYAGMPFLCAPTINSPWSNNSDHTAPAYARSLSCVL
jgi:hypothetical protein